MRNKFTLNKKAKRSYSPNKMSIYVNVPIFSDRIYARPDITIYFEIFSRANNRRVFCFGKTLLIFCRP